MIREDAFRKQIKSGLAGGYFFYGDEDYLKVHALKSARAAVSPDEGLAVFNDVRMDAMTFSAQALIDALQPLPMLEDKKIVTVTGLPLASMRQSEVEDLFDALETLAEYDYNVLILSIPAGQLDVGTPKKPSALFTRLKKYLTPVCFDSITGARLVSWVGKHFAAHGVKASPAVCSYLVEYSGHAMFTLANETEKLSQYVLANDRDEVTQADVDLVATSVIENEAYALTNALIEGRGDKALQALSVMKFEQAEPVKIFSEISFAVADMLTVKAMLEQGAPIVDIAAALKKGGEYKARLYASAVAKRPIERLRRALTLCAEADLALKSSSIRGYEAIERLICSL